MILNYREWRHRLHESATVELDSGPESDSWARRAVDVIPSDPKWQYLLQEFPSPTPAVEMDLISLANERFAGNPGGWCWSGGKCYQKILGYRLGSNPAFHELNWNWYPAEGRGEFKPVASLKALIVIDVSDESDSLSPEEIQSLVIEALKQAGVTDIRVAAAVLGVAGKESGLTPVPEQIHKEKSLKTLRGWYPALSRYSDPQIRELQKNPDLFYEAVYGPNTATGRGLGNIYPGDGQKYRGRGYNQATGRSVYSLIGYADNPERLLKPKHATIALVRYFDKVSRILKKKYPEDQALRSIVREFVWANGGWAPGETSANAEAQFLKTLQWIQKHLIQSDGKQSNLTNRLVVPGYSSLDLKGGLLLG